MIFQAKQLIRNHIVKLRDEVDDKIRQKWDKIIFERLINSPFYKEAKVIFVFVSFGSEVDTRRFIQHALKEGKIICVPKIPSKKTGIEVFRIHGFEDLEEGYYKILEPLNHCQRIAKEEIDLILMPGVAFDEIGSRIGYGAGFYDRFLKDLPKKIHKIGLAYDIQVLNDIPTNEFDEKIDGIITNEDVLSFL